MHKISDKDKKLWNFYISNLDSIKKVKFGGKSKKIAKGLIAEIEG